MSPRVAVQDHTRFHSQLVTSESRTVRPALDECPNKRDWILAWDYTDDEPIYADCGGLTCPYCIRIRAWKRRLAIRAVGPTHFMTITALANLSDVGLWPAVRTKIKRFNDLAQLQFGRRLDFSYTVEAGAANGMIHAHFNVRDLPPAASARALSQLAQRVGAGHADLRVWDAQRHDGYSLKEFTKAPDIAGAALALNGGRLTHETRGFYGGPVREVEAEAVRARYGRHRRPMAPTCPSERGARQRLSARAGALSLTSLATETHNNRSNVR